MSQPSRSDLLFELAYKLKEAEEKEAKKKEAAPDLLVDRLLTMPQVAEKYPHLFTYDSLRWRVSTGQLGDAVVRLGRKVWIDLEKLSALLEKGRVTGRTF